jgi:uncharacterized membrane protein
MLFLLSGVLFGLILLAIGAVLLIKLKNKLAGILVMTVGLVFTLFPIAIYLFFTTIARIQG